MYLYVIAVSISFFSVLLYYFIIPSPNTNTLHNILDGTLKTVYYLLCISKGYLHSRLSIEPSNCNRKTNINRCLVITPSNILINVILQSKIDVKNQIN